PGCTIESVSIFPSYLDQLRRFAPTHLAQLLFWNPRQVLVNGHQVVGLPPRIRETLCQEFIKRLQSLQPPVLLRPDLTQIFPKLDKARILLLLLGPLPAQDLVDL